jgi:hypothetical protein
VFVDFDFVADVMESVGVTANERESGAEVASCSWIWI